MKTKYFKIIAILISFCLAFEQSGFAQIAGQMDISSYVMGLGRQVAMDKFRPLHLRSIGYDQAQNNFHLLLDKGDAKDLNPQFVKDSTQQLLKYFLVGVTLPNDSFWVNLKPDAPDNVIEENLARTEVGRILLESDLQLKKDTAQATSPETPEGKRYWELLYKKAAELFGNDNVTIPTLVRPWIVPDEIIIRESDSTAYIYKATLKVMLEEDYLKNSGLYNFKDPRLKALNEYSARLIRESIIPKLNRQVNSAKRYAALRQVYYSIILAQWFKSRLSGRNNAYSALIDRRNLANLIAQGNWSVRSYFDAYRKSFQEGEYNLKENIYTPYGQNIRTYTSGGIALQDVFRSEPPPAGGKNVFSSPVHIIDMRAIQDETALAASPNIISAVTSGAEVEKVEVKSNPPVSQGSSPLTMREVNLKMLEAFVERGPEAFSIAANRAVLVAISQGLNFYTDEIGSLSDKIASAGNKNASSDKRALSEYASALSTLLEINPRFSSTNLSTIDIYDDLRNFMHEIAHINFFIQVAEVSLTETPGVYDKLTQLDKHHLNYEALRTIARWERFAYFDTETVGRFFSAISRHINDSKASLKEIEAILKNSPETVEPGATKFFLESLLEQEKKAKRDLEQLGEMQRELNAPVKREPLDVVSLVKDVVASYNGALQVEFVWDTPD
ncbi:MAG TPA: hypothetical protein VMD04_00320, partial [Candidatus Margulisiibacteriota bacterium]|nr:hypothetical protein [Candidatus Margulisiibacteriota bacterium]